MGNANCCDKSTNINSSSGGSRSKPSYISSEFHSSKILHLSSQREVKRNRALSESGNSGSWVAAYEKGRVPKNTLTNCKEEDLYSKEVNISQFQILKLLGKGGFGKVFLVKHRETDKVYAMKTLHKDEYKCYAERTILEKVKSNFTVKLQYAFQSPDKAYFVVDFMSGGDLKYHLEKAEFFNVKRARFHAAECVLALKDMHKLGVIYRDLKLDNILLDHEGHLKITDFGLSRLGITKETMVNSFVGTPSYIAPEIIKQKGYSFEADWWSLGIILYQMLTGKSPFKGYCVRKTLENILEVDVSFDDITSTSARDLLEKLLKKDPTKRIGLKEIMKHKFFSKIDWIKLHQRKLKPPYKPTKFQIDNPKYFKRKFLREPAEDSYVKSDLTLKEKRDNHLLKFTYKKKESATH